MITEITPAAMTTLGSIFIAVSSSASKYLINPAAEWKPSPFFPFFGGAIIIHNNHYYKNLVQAKQDCRVQKLFRRIKPSPEMTKLSDKKIRWICRHVVDIGDWDKSQIANQYGVSVRRVEQLVKSFDLNFGCCSWSMKEQNITSSLSFQG